MAKQQRKTTTPPSSNKGDKNKKSKKIVNQHDLFFKQTFSDKDVAESYIQHFIDEKLLQYIDLPSLTLDPTSYITPDSVEYASDLVWVARYNQTSIKIAFLFEHKSYVVP